MQIGYYMHTKIILFITFVLQNSANKTYLGLKQAVIGEQDVSIFKPITLRPPVLVFPWTTAGKLDCSYKLKVS